MKWYTAYYGSHIAEHRNLMNAWIGSIYRALIAYWPLEVGSMPSAILGWGDEPEFTLAQWAVRMGTEGGSQEHVRVRHEARTGHVRSTYQHQTTWRLSGHGNLVNLIRWPMQWRLSIEPYWPCMHMHSCYLILFCLVWNSRIAIS